MTLDEAIAEVKRYAEEAGPLEAREFLNLTDPGDLALAQDAGPTEIALATVLNAVASGELIHAADAGLAEVRAYQRAASVAVNACLVPPDGGNPTEAERIVCEAAGEYILALAPADALAEVARLKAAIIEARDAAHSLAHSEFDGVWSADDFLTLTPLADAALKGDTP